jgi:hypothetical protein
MAAIGGIQTLVNEIPGVAVDGAFCDLNPRFNTLAGPGAFVAGVPGVYIGRFAWAYPPVDPNGANQIVLNSGSGLPSGFIANAFQGLNTTYLSSASLFIPQGFAVTLFSEADVWVRNTGATQALFGQKVYANLSTGLCTFGPTGQLTAGASGSASTVAAATFAVTGSIAGNILSVSAVTSGTIYPGSTISGTGIAAGTQIVSQAGGAPGGIGTYYVSIPEQTVASTAVAGTYGLLTIGGTVVPGFAVGQTITGGSVVAGTQITAPITGTGGAGTYAVNNNTVVGSTAISVASINVETNYFAR